MSENEWRAPETKNREAGYMVRCKCKVGGATRVTIDEEIYVQSEVSGHVANGTAEGRPVYARRVTRSSYARTERTMTFLTWAYSSMTQAPAHCVRCGTRYKVDRIIAVKNTTPCDRKCTHAKGFKCECSCGGKNHGSQA